MNEKKYRISKSAILASVLDKVGFYCMTQKQEEKQLAQTALTQILPILMPRVVVTDEDKATVSVVVAIAGVVDLMEIEAQGLQLLNGKLDDAQFDALAKFNQDDTVRDEDFLYSFTPRVLPMMVEAGLKSVEGSYDELDTLEAKVSR